MLVFSVFGDVNWIRRFVESISAGRRGLGVRGKDVCQRLKLLALDGN
jgi:hypothetical protein